jgi:hypothetical protein
LWWWYSKRSLSINKNRSNSKIFSLQPLARLGASVLGIDVVSENISTAQFHVDLSLKENIQYKHGLYFIRL